MTKPEPMGEHDILALLIDAGCLGLVKMTYESGPYEITRPTIHSFRFTRAIEAARDAAWQAREDAAPKQDDADRQLLRALFEVCEATEEECADSQDSFKRGRAWEAKSIRRGVGTWYQDTFCGPTHMGEPVVQPRTYTQAEVDALVAALGDYLVASDKAWQHTCLEAKKIGILYVPCSPSQADALDKHNALRDALKQFNGEGVTPCVYTQAEVDVLVAQEREACAVAVEEEHVGSDVQDACDNVGDAVYNQALRDGAAAIRARTQEGGSHG